MRLNTINVVVYYDNCLYSLDAFPANPEGCEEAEKFFADKIKEYDGNDVDQSDIEDATEDGSYYAKNNREIYLCHSAGVDIEQQAKKLGFTA